MKTYEAMILLDNREVKRGWAPLKETIDSCLTKNGAEIVVAKRWDERKLAYEIRKQRRATYYLVYFKVDTQKIAEIRRTLQLTAPVLRHLVLACEVVPPEAYEPEKEFDMSRFDEAVEEVVVPVPEVEAAVEAEVPVAIESDEQQEAAKE